MPRQLHILTRPADPLVVSLLEAERAAGEVELTVTDLTQPDPDYAALVEQVFAADSVVTW